MVAEDRARIRVKRTKLVLVAYVPIPAFHGLSYRVTGILRAVVDKKVECEVVCPDNTLDPCSVTSRYRINKVRADWRNLIAGPRVRRFLELLKFMIGSFPILVRLSRDRSTVFQFEQVFLFPLALVSKLLFRRKVILDDFNLLRPDYHFLPKVVLELVDRLALLSCDFVVTASPLTRDWMRRNFPSKPMRFVPNGVTPNDEGFRVEERVEEDHGCALALFVGGLSFHQNLVAVGRIVRLSERLHRRGSPVRIEVIGGPISLARQFLSTQAAITGLVRFRGFVSAEELGAAYRRARIGLLPFFADTPLAGGYRTKALEYLNSGLLVISGPEGVGGLHDILPGQHYLLAEDEDSFVDTLDRVVRNPAEFESLRSDGRRTVGRLYSWSIVAAPLVQVILGAS